MISFTNEQQVYATGMRYNYPRRATVTHVESDVCRIHFKVFVRHDFTLLRSRILPRNLFR